MRRWFACALAAVTALIGAAAAAGAQQPVPLGPNGGWVMGAGSAYQCSLTSNFAVCNRQWPGAGGVQSWGAVAVWLPAECMGMWMREGDLDGDRPAELWLYNPDPTSPQGCAPGIRDTPNLGWCIYRQPDPWQPGWCDRHEGQASLDNRWVSQQRVWMGGQRYGTVIRLY